MRWWPRLHPAAWVASAAAEVAWAAGVPGAEEEEAAEAAPRRSRQKFAGFAQRKHRQRRSRRPAPAASPAAQAREQLVQYSQQSQFVNGRNFFQNGSQWMDSEVQNNQSAKHTRLQFNSPEYFEFLVKNQKALPWLALGQNVQFVLDGTVYEIYE